MSQPEMSLQPVNPDNMEHVTFLYELLRERPEYANISHGKMPDFAEHRAFLWSQPYWCWYIIAVPVMVGCIYLTRADEIGVHIKPTNMGTEIASRSIELLMHMHPRKRYLANVAPGNQSAHALFQDLGKVIQHTYEIPGTEGAANVG